MSKTFNACTLSESETIGATTSTGSEKSWKWAEPEVVRDYFRNEKINVRKYRQRSKHNKLPEGFPGDPNQFYGKPWSWFSGTVRNKSFVEPEVVRDYVQNEKLSWKRYSKRSKSDLLPEGFPGNPSITYSKPWSWFSGALAPKNMYFIGPEAVKDYVRNEKLTQKEYQQRSKSGLLPEGFPSNPERTYNKPWSWFSGVMKGKSFVEPEIVRDYVRNKKLNRKEYQQRSKSNLLPEGFPGGPSITYNKPWSWFSGRERN